MNTASWRSARNSSWSGVTPSISVKLRASVRFMVKCTPAMVAPGPEG